VQDISRSPRNAQICSRVHPVLYSTSAVAMGVKWPGYETDHSTPSSATVNNKRGYTTTPTYAFTVCTGTTLLYFTLFIKSGCPQWWETVTVWWRYIPDGKMLPAKVELMYAGCLLLAHITEASDTNSCCKIL